MASRKDRAARKLRFGVNSALEELGRVRDNEFCDEEPLREADSDEEEETDFEEYVHIVT